MQPLMRPAEVAHIRSIIAASAPDFHMIEWGAGGSTIEWLITGGPGRIVTTIEHRAEWSERVRAAAPDWRNIYLVQPDITDYDPGYGTLSEENPTYMGHYIHTGLDPSADLFFIDGVARGTIAALLRYIAKPSARMFIHDGQRDWYDWVKPLYSKIEMTEGLMELIR